MLKFTKRILFITVICVFTFSSACTNTNEYQESDECEIGSSYAAETMENNRSGEETSNKYASIYTAEPLHFSEESINCFLSYCGDSVIDSQNKIGDSSKRYSGICNSGKQFVCHENTGYHPHTVFQYIDSEKNDRYYTYPIYSGEEQYETNKQYNVGWMFTEARNFDFATAKEAEEYVRTALSFLGCKDLSLFRTLYIDHNIMEEAVKELTTNPIYAPIGNEKENNGYPVLTDWTEADDAYLFSFGITVENTTLSPRFESRETTTYIGSEIIVWYSENGIDFLSVDMPWIVGKEKQKPELLISEQTAMAVVKEKMDSILTFRNIIYDDPALEYQYQQEGNEWILFPVWTIKVSYQHIGSDITQYKFVSVDAISGKEL